MSPLVSRFEAADVSLRQLYAPIAQELEAVEEILRRELRSQHAYVDELVRYGCLLGGKRLRPVLLLLSGQAFGRITRKHRVLAAVIEMIHTATLVHDDVLDEADTRRHLATVNSRWDNKTSILLGDFLFTHAFYLGSSIGSSQACRIVGKATNTVCEGELRQKGARGDYSLSEEQYLDIIAAKTAELCACSSQLGAKFAGATADWARRMAAYGRAVGIAFQIVDDVLDLQGDERTVGKSLGTDLEQQKATLPVIHLLRSATPADREHVLSILRGESPSRARALAPWLQRYDACGYSYDVARRYAREAIQQLDGLRPSLARQTLEALSEFVVSRSL